MIGPQLLPQLADQTHRLIFLRTAVPVPPSRRLPRRLFRRHDCILASKTCSLQGSQGGSVPAGVERDVRQRLAIVERRRLDRRLVRFDLGAQPVAEALLGRPGHERGDIDLDLRGVRRAFRTPLGKLIALVPSAA